MWWLVKHLPGESAMWRAEEPSMAWTAGEHLLAMAVDRLSEIAYVTTVVNTEQKDRKKIQFPEPIVRPGAKQPERRHRRPRTIQLDPGEWGGMPIETSAEEVS